MATPERPKVLVDPCAESTPALSRRSSQGALGVLGALADVTNGTGTTSPTGKGCLRGRFNNRSGSFKRKTSKSGVQKEESYVLVSGKYQPAPPAPVEDDAEENEVTEVGGENDRYLKSSLLGIGQYRDVYLALDTEQGVEVAWMEQTKADVEDHQEFSAEIELLQAIDHPHIMPFLDFWETKEKRVLITELMSGGNVKDFLRKTGRPRLKVLQTWCRHILKALSYLHTRTPKIVHREVNCSNLFIDMSTSNVRLGHLAGAYAMKDGTATGITGDMAFRAPEMYDGKYTESVDIYAFGLAVTEMLTLDSPYADVKAEAGDHAQEEIIRQSKTTGPSVVQRVRRAPAKDFITACICPNPADRAAIKDLLTHPFMQREDSMSPTPPKMLFHLQNINRNGSLEVRITKLWPAQAFSPEPSCAQSIDFTLNLGEEPADVTRLLVAEELIDENDAEEVTQRLTALAACVDDVTMNADNKILAQLRADIIVRLDHDSSTQAKRVQKDLDEVIRQQAVQRRTLVREQILQLRALEDSLVATGYASPSPRKLSTGSLSSSLSRAASSSSTAATPTSARAHLNASANGSFFHSLDSVPEQPPRAVPWRLADV
eukprot:m.34883 g.34883  ORF g.34883 m.34883 type:complete len:602 (-) comp13140_c0_seq1:99-1904(-)